MVERRRRQPRAHRLHAHSDERHRRGPGSRGCAHEHRGAVRLLLREVGREPHERREPRDDGRARRRAALHAAAAKHRRPARRPRIHGRLGCDEPDGRVRARHARARPRLAAARRQRQCHESERRHERRGPHRHPQLGSRDLQSAASAVRRHARRHDRERHGRHEPSRPRRRREARRQRRSERQRPGRSRRRGRRGSRRA